MIDYKNYLPLQISAHRRQMGLSQEKLAELAGVDRKTITFLESFNSQKSVRLDTLMCVLSVLGLTLKIE